MKNEITLTEDRYTDEKIASGSVVLVQSLGGDELQYDTMDATLDFSSLLPTIFMPSDSDGIMTSESEVFGVRPMIRIMVTDPSLYKYGEEVIYRHNGLLVGKYYMTAMTRVGKTQYRISCVSPVGLLTNSQHYGGIYSGTSFSDLIKEIIGGVVPYSVAPEIENQPVYGWLPVATRRDNLHQALFAMGAVAQKDDNGDLIIKPLIDDVHIEIPDSRIYFGGYVNYPDAVTKVSISEHTFVANGADETVTLFEGLVASEQITTPSGAIAQGSLILFNDPMHDLLIENGEILESGVNFAVIAPSAECKLTGQKYTHTVRQVTRPEAPDTRSSETENKINVTDATLISIANSENVADRLMSYYSSAKTINTNIVVDSERAGTAVQLTDPFGDLAKGIIKSLDVTMSNTLKGNAEIITDFSPGSAGNFYTKMELLTSDGTWSVPSGVTKIRVAVIGGGTGGYSGASGEDGEKGQESLTGTGMGAGWGTWGTGGKGGAKGQGGPGGRILVLSLNVEEGQTFAVKIGKGGVGGICSGTENTPGEEGTDTTFGDYTSADGIRSITGYRDLFGSTSYGVSGKSGVSDGGNGSSGGTGSGPEVVGDSITIGGITYVSGERGNQAIGSYNDGSGISRRLVVAGGGNGGGAAAGANGGDGEDGQTVVDANESVAICGPGGIGADAAFPGESGITYGSGGQGGSGGGGGGGGGSGFAYQSGTFVIGGAGGTGGTGSRGGAGADGCVVIYS